VAPPRIIRQHSALISYRIYAILPTGGDNMKKSRIIFLLFIIFGLILSVGGAFICVNAFDYSGKAETIAEITDFESYRDDEGSMRYKTHLTYEVDGQSYTNVTKMHSSSWNIGEEIEIHYDVDNPQNIGSKHTDLALLVVPCLGLLFFALV